MKITLFGLFALLLLFACDSSRPTPKSPQKETVVVIDAQPEPLEEVIADNANAAHKKLIFNTQLSISATQPNWVLFEHGTYVIFPKGTTRDDMRKSSLGLLQRYNNESFTIRKSQLVKGWVGSSRKEIYNYISLDQASSRMADNKELALLSKANVIKDKERPVIIHINTPQ